MKKYEQSLFIVTLCIINCVHSEIDSNMTGVPVKVFEATNMEDVFTDTCWPIHFPCSSDMQNLPDPTNCQYYFQCAEFIVWRTPCAGGTAFNTSSSTCINEFYADCSCPPDSPWDQTTQGPTTMPTTVIPATKEPSTGSDDNTGLIAGVIAALAICIILLVVLFVYIRIRKRQIKERNKNLSVKSTGSEKYAAIDEDMVDPSYKKPVEPYMTPEGRKNLPPLPDTQVIENETVYDNSDGKVMSESDPNYDNNGKVSDGGKAVPPPVGRAEPNSYLDLETASKRKTGDSSTVDAVTNENPYYG